MQDLAHWLAEAPLPAQPRSLTKYRIGLTDAWHRAIEGRDSAQYADNHPGMH